ncbi:MAG TPA: 8-oxo-dGTP diphosphatase [Urbifossiella sp.]|nr:8-oxo-dGTP diphosphatase [Urbifossiella sp.]
MPYTPILATLGYVFSPDRRRVLMVHRNARPGDAHLGKYNGLGGKLDPGEDVVSGMRRELREEAGIECDAIQLAGTVSWPGFGPGGEDWFGFIFRVFAFHGTPPAANAEGTLEWVEVSRVGELPLWEGDRHFLPFVFDFTLPQFHGVMPYQNGRPVRWSVSLLPAVNLGGLGSPPGV